MTYRRAVPDSITFVAPPPSGLDTWSGPLGICYCEVFCGPPWNEAAHTSACFRERLRLKSVRPGFRIVLALERGRLLGFCYGAATIADPELEPWYAPIIDALGPGVTDAALVDAFELVDLGVIPTARGRGIGSRLHDALLAGVTERQAWLMTRVDATEACAFYRGHGWLELTSFGPPDQPGQKLLMTRRLR